MLTISGRLDGASPDMYSNPVHIDRSLSMPRHATYTYVREHLARLLEQVEADRDVVIIIVAATKPWRSCRRAGSSGSSRPLTPGARPRTPRRSSPHWLG